jgi:hypothetical protein
MAELLPKPISLVKVQVRCLLFLRSLRCVHANACADDMLRWTARCVA